MILETPRMALRRFKPDDWQDLRRIHGDARATDTLSQDGAPLPEDWSRASALMWTAHWDIYGFGIWHAADRDTGTFCGYGGMRLLLLDGKPIVELAYAVVPALWRQGRAYEIASATTDWMFETMALQEAWCFTLTRNVASQKVMQRAGFTYSHAAARAGLPHVFYKMTQEQWRAGQESRPPAP